jgi:membrane protein
MHWKDVFELLKHTASGWLERETFQHGAALSFYAAFALAPTLVIAIALAGIVFGEDAAKGQLDVVLSEAFGPNVARAFVDMLAYVHVTGSGWIATLIGFGLVLFAATGLFIQLQLALNAIWGVPPRQGFSLWAMVRSRLMAFILLLVIGALLFVSLIGNAVLGFLRTRLANAAWSIEPLVWEGMDWLLSLVLLTLLCAIIFKLLPETLVAWRDVWTGAAATAVLFVLGNFLFCQYVCRAAPATVYGPAGSLVVVMLWVYYSSQILLFGAELTKQIAVRYRTPIHPADNGIGRSSESVRP